MIIIKYRIHLNFQYIPLQNQYEILHFCCTSAQLKQVQLNGIGVVNGRLIFEKQKGIPFPNFSKTC